MLAQVDPKLNKNLFERLLEQCARRALQGSKWHMGVLLDYGLGKPTQMLEHSGGIDLRSILAEARRRAEAALPALPASTEANGAIRRAQSAAESAEQGTASEDAAEQPARPKIRVEPWAN